MSRAEVQKWLPQLPGWEIVQIEGEDALRKSFSFKDFASALAFANRVGEMADQENHHPALLTEWGRTTVSWWTHSAGGIHTNDLIMAARTEELARGKAAG